ncbi:kinetochore protein spc25 [Plasmopara halstedii]|uniref:Kinetochore protein SPC25 n=1 Tax=Plasmopara halstedii TaxID=4781 RepID=A0A0N7L3K3_PLAHL|nr:kinetochore protein spc25 [Plasmopara halstedii]CEG36115.1 kinetochore protein spc25 [Plasmopara halstedii]|eukprot:XP_024572484.1 kinetochore protein spc25 [Plasmopara halstedii]
MHEPWRPAGLPPPLEIETLVQSNLSTRTDLEAWVEAQKSHILEEKRADQQQLQEHARASDEAQRKREMLQIEHQKLLADTHAKERELNTSQMEIEVLQTERRRREPVVKELFEKTVEEDVKLKRLLAESQTQRAKQEHQLQELKQGLAMYQRLGLFFEHTETDRIVVKFTQIDAQDTNREFSFRITIDSITDKYLVDACSEQVPKLNHLVMDLNENGDLALFIRSMRRQFKKLCE